MSRTFSIETFDQIRAAFPDMAVALYALEPGMGVTLEIIDPDGGLFSFKGATAAEAIARAFPPAPADPDPPPVAEVATDIFD